MFNIYFSLLVMDYMTIMSQTVDETNTRGTIGPGRYPLAYLLFFVITVNPAYA